MNNFLISNLQLLQNGKYTNGGGGPRGTLWNSKVKFLNSTKKVPQIPHKLFTSNFFPSHAFLRRRRKKALIRVRNRRDFENGVK